MPSAKGSVAKTTAPVAKDKKVVAKKEVVAESPPVIEKVANFKESISEDELYYYYNS